MIVSQNDFSPNKRANYDQWSTCMCCCRSSRLRLIALGLYECILLDLDHWTNRALSTALTGTHEAITLHVSKFLASQATFNHADMCTCFTYMLCMYQTVDKPQKVILEMVWLQCRNFNVILLKIALSVWAKFSNKGAMCMWNCGSSMYCTCCTPVFLHCSFSWIWSLWQSHLQTCWINATASWGIYVKYIYKHM